MAQEKILLIAREAIVTVEIVLTIETTKGSKIRAREIQSSRRLSTKIVKMTNPKEDFKNNGVQLKGKEVKGVGKMMMIVAIETIEAAKVFEIGIKNKIAKVVEIKSMTLVIVMLSTAKIK